MADQPPENSTGSGSQKWFSEQTPAARFWLSVLILVVLPLAGAALVGWGWYLALNQLELQDRRKGILPSGFFGMLFFLQGVNRWVRIAQLRQMVREGVPESDERFVQTSRALYEMNGFGVPEIVGCCIIGVNIAASCAKGYGWF